MSEPQILSGILYESGRLDKVLAETTSLSRERVKALIAEGKVHWRHASPPAPRSKFKLV